MRIYRSLPDFQRTELRGPDWFLNLLAKLSKEDRVPLLLLLWKNWSDRNAMTHAGEKFSAERSVRALEAMYNSLLQIRQPEGVDLKGKRPLGEVRETRERSARQNAMQSAPMARWKPPAHGWIKLNVEGSFVETSAGSSPGVVIRDHAGKVLLSSWCSLPSCSSAQEVEYLPVVKVYPSQNNGSMVQLFLNQTE